MQHGKCALHKVVLVFPFKQFSKCLCLPYWRSSRMLIFSETSRAYSQSMTEIWLWGYGVVLSISSPLHLAIWYPLFWFTSQLLVKSWSHYEWSIRQQLSVFPVVAECFSREALIKSARADSKRFWLSRKFQKRRNTGCISLFWNCTGEAKDLLLSRRRFIQSFPNYL